MILSYRAALTLSLALCVPAQAHAAACDYTPSRLFDQTTQTSETGTLAAEDQTGGYTLLAAKSGEPLLGRAIAGRSATELAGAASGAGGVLSTLASIAAAPVTLIAGAVTAVAVGGFEGVCYFSVERVTDPDALLPILRDMERNANPEYFWLETPEDADTPVLYVRDLEDANTLASYDVSRLYIGDGMLRHRDRGLNTAIGRVIYLEVEPDAPVD